MHCLWKQEKQGHLKTFTCPSRMTAGETGSNPPTGRQSHWSKEWHYNLRLTHGSSLCQGFLSILNMTKTHKSLIGCLLPITEFRDNYFICNSPGDPRNREAETSATEAEFKEWGLFQESGYPPYLTAWQGNESSMIFCPKSKQVISGTSIKAGLRLHIKGS